MSTIARILFPYDFSAHALEAAKAVRSMARRFGAGVTLYSVLPPVWDPTPEGMEPLTLADPASRISALQARLDNSLMEELSGVEVDRVADSGDPAARIKAFTESHNVDLVMMATHGQGTFRASLVGSVTAKVLHDVACPVWTAAHTETPTVAKPPRTILCAVDGAEHTPSVLAFADMFSRAAGASLMILHVVPPVSDWDSLPGERALQEHARDDAEAKIAGLQQTAGVVAPLRVTVGEIGATVAEQARLEHADLLIAGRGAVAGRFARLRAHTFDIIERSACPVLNV
jgi:nucleotide-binding universal stress UspA family protein